jgi:hypothetical protein
VRPEVANQELGHLVELVPDSSHTGQQRQRPHGTRFRVKALYTYASPDS